MSPRIKRINSLIAQLEQMKRDPSFSSKTYAIDQNVIFLRSVKSPFGYIKWLFHDRKKINKNLLKELTDFPVPEWDREMHERLIIVERDPKIGLGKALVQKIEEKLRNRNGVQVIINIGAGPMEFDRQIAEKILSSSLNKPVIMIGVDLSSEARKMAEENLSAISGATIISIDKLTQSKLDEIKSNSKGLTFVIASNDIFALDKDLEKDSADIIYSSLFEHHLSESDRERIHGIMKFVSKNAYVFDGFQAWIPLIPQSVVAWKHPVFLVGTVFSVFRYFKKHDLKKLEGEVQIYNKTGHYLQTLKK